MSSLQHILAPDPSETTPIPIESAASLDEPTAPTMLPDLIDSIEERATETPRPDDEDVARHSSTTTSTRRNPSGSVSSVYSGNKMRHLKKDDGIPLWRKDIQYDFLRLVFYDDTKCFAKFSDGTNGHTFADIYIDAMAKSSKCSGILKEKLLQDREGAICMAMVCLLVNVGRMNTTLNFFPEMRAQLRTYHSIPALQARQDPNAYKQLQDAPRLKSILKGATEDEPQPSTMDEIRATTKKPRTNPVNLIFVMSQYTLKISEVHFSPPRDFLDLIMRGSLSSASRARAFLWLIWWYLESDFSYEDSQRNPFGAGLPADGEEDPDALPLKVPTLESLTEEQAALENVDTEEERSFGEVKRKERTAILALDPSPAMTALKRSRKEKEKITGHGVHASDDDISEPGWYRITDAKAYPNSTTKTREGSEYTRSPSPAAAQGFQAVNTSAKLTGDMRIHDLLNTDDAAPEASPPHVTPAPSTSAPVKKGPGRGNWRRNKAPKTESSVPIAARRTESSHHVALLPNNTTPLSFVNEATHTPIQPATPGSGAYAYHNSSVSHASPPQGTSITFQPPSTREHVPTPSYQAQKRHRGITQHQSAVINHRKQQIDYTLDRRIRKMHIRARDWRESEGSILRAWKRIRRMPIDYDSEEEAIKVRKAKERVDKDDEGRAAHKGKENVDVPEEKESLRRPRLLMAGLTRVDGEAMDVGEEAKVMAKAFQRCARRVERWQDTGLPGQAMIRRRQLQMQGPVSKARRRKSSSTKRLSMDRDGVESIEDERHTRRSIPRRKSGTGRANRLREASAGVSVEPRVELEAEDEDDGGGELDEEDREMLGEVDVDESEDDEEDEEMGDD